MNAETYFPDDDNGCVLRRMHEAGDNLTRARDIDFTVVLPTEDAAALFAAHFTAAGYQVKTEPSYCVPELPWDVVVVKHMLPEHAGITAFEDDLEKIALPLGGRNDGWGCFKQPDNIHWNDGSS